MSMLQEFALIPDVFEASVGDKSLEAILEQLLRGIAENGLIANLQKGAWSQFVLDEKCTRLSASHRANVLELLEKLDKNRRLIKFPRYKDISYLLNNLGSGGSGEGCGRGATLTDEVGQCRQATGA
jgi:hypothetical protein